jgi:hypothetical protein
MQGTLQRQKGGYKWMRIGYANTGFSFAILTGSFTIIILLAIWAFREMPDTEWRLVNFLSIYFVAAITYMNIGVWLHEQLHCLPFRGTLPENRTHINYIRKYILFLSGHYRVRGAIDYHTNRNALLAPFILSVVLSAVGVLGNLVLPGWWLPILLTMAVAGILDMTHDFYMYSQIRVVGKKGKYWDIGKYMEAVWKD